MEKRSREDARTSKKNNVKRIIRERLALSDINDMVVCDVNYNLGLFGVIIDEKEAENYLENTSNNLLECSNIYEESLQAKTARENFLRHCLNDYKSSNFVGNCGQ